MSIPAGWYDDGSGTQRWWDGTDWTEHVAAPPAQPSGESAAGYAAQPTAGYAAQPATGYAPQHPAPPTNGLAIAALVLGILGFGIVPVILGHIALGQIKQRPPQGGRGMAIAGLVLGYVAIAVGVLLVGIVLLAAFYTSVANAAYYR